MRIQNLVKRKVKNKSGSNMSYIILKLNKKTTKELGELYNSNKTNLRDFLKDQVLEMAVSRTLAQETKVAQEKIKQIHFELEKKKESMKEDIDK